MKSQKKLIPVLLVILCLAGTPWQNAFGSEACEKLVSTKKAPPFKSHNIVIAETLSGQLPKKISDRELRVAASEYLARSVQSGVVRPMASARRIANAIIFDQWGEDELQMVDNYLSLIDSIIKSSVTIRRPHALSSSDADRIPTHVIESLVPTTSPREPEQRQEKKQKGFFGRMFSGSGGERVKTPTAPPSEHLRFVDSEDLRRTLLTKDLNYPLHLTQALDSKNVLLTHLEALRILSAVPDGPELEESIAIVKKHTFTNIMIFDLDDYLTLLRLFESPKAQIMVFQKFILDDQNFRIANMSIPEFAERVTDFSDQIVQPLLARVQFSKMNLEEIGNVLRLDPRIVASPWLLKKLYEDLSQAPDSWTSKRAYISTILAVDSAPSLEKYTALVGADTPSAIDQLITDALTGAPLSPFEVQFLKNKIGSWKTDKDYFSRREIVLQLAATPQLGLEDLVPAGTPTYLEIQSHRGQIAQLKRSEVIAFAKVISVADHADWFERVELLSDLADTVTDRTGVIPESVVLPTDLGTTNLVQNLRTRIDRGVFDFELQLYAKALAMVDLPWADRRELLNKLLRGYSKPNQVLEVFFEMLPENAISLEEVRNLPNGGLPSFEVHAYLRVVAAERMDWQKRLELADSVIGRGTASTRDGLRQEFFNQVAESWPPSVDEISARISLNEGLWFPEATFYAQVLARQSNIPFAERVARLAQISEKFATTHRETLERSFLDIALKLNLKLADIEACLSNDTGLSEVFAEMLVGPLSSMSDPWERRRAAFVALKDRVSEAKRPVLMDRFFGNLKSSLDLATISEYLARNPQLFLEEALGYAKILFPTLKTEDELRTTAFQLAHLVADTDKDLVLTRLTRELETALGPEEVGLRRIERNVAAGLNSLEIVTLILTEVPEDFLRSLSAQGAARLLRLIPSQESIPLNAIKARKSQRLLVDLRDHGRAVTKGEWTATDLLLMGVDANMAAMHRVLHLARGTNTFDHQLAQEVSDHLNDIVDSSGLHDMTDADYAEFKRLGRKLSTTAQQRHLTQESVRSLFNNEFIRVFGAQAQ